MRKIVILIAVLILFTACDRNGNKKGNGSSTPVPTEPQPYPVIIDGVEIKECPSAIISLSPALTEILYEFGAGEKLIARSEYCNFPLPVNDIKSVKSGSGFDVDEILELNPDLLLLSASISDKDKLMLEREGIPTVVIPSPNNLDEFENIYRIMGLILNGAFVGEEEGQKAFADIREAIDNVGTINLGNFIYITENMSVATGDTLESAVLSCYGTNLAKDDKDYVFDKAKLLEIQPDTVIINSIYTVDDLISSETAETGNGENVFAQLSAVQNGKVIILNNMFFERPSGRITTLISSLNTQFITIKR